MPGLQRMKADMDPIEFPLDEYYERTGVSSSDGITVDRLEALHQAQWTSIPYENFDVLLGRGVDLAVDALVNKLVRAPRGGYCFELNGLMLQVLKAEGFNVRPLLGRVHITGESTGRGHQIALVTVDGREWIVDVGNGAYCPRMPIPFEHDVETQHGGTPYRLIAHHLGHMLQLEVRGNWKDLYSFDLTPVVQADIDYGNHFTSTHPSSIFTWARIASLGHRDGQTIIFNDVCTVRGEGREAPQALPDDERYLEILKEKVGIDLDATYDELPPLVKQ